MKAAMHQSQYLPWPPYFKKVAACDVFVLMDSVQYQKNGVQNRNQVRGREGAFWLTVPVTGRLEDSIAAKPLAGGQWRAKHWKSIVSAYQRAPRWAELGPSLEKAYASPAATLGEINERLFFLLLEHLELPAKVVRLSELKAEGAKTALLLSALRAVGADVYVSGTGGKDYLDEGLFREAGVALEWLESVPPEYPQFHGGPFIPGLSMLDMLMNVGVAAAREWLREGVRA